MNNPSPRGCIAAILDGSIHESEFTQCPYVGFDIPKTLEGIDSSVLNPYDAWEDKEAFDAASRNLAGMFVEKFDKFAEDNEVLLQHGPIGWSHRNG